jgi:GDP-mannose 6-dehydrogenase
MKSVSVFGVGYVGCVTAACLSRDGHNVVGVDVNSEKVAMLNSGHSPVNEPGLDDLVHKQVAKGTLKATVNLPQAVRETKIGLIAVGTPSMIDGAVSSQAVERVVEDIGKALRGSSQDFTVVVRSTLLPGILEERLAPLLSESSGRPLGARLQLCNNPEFLREAVAIRDYDNPPFVVIGTLDAWDAVNVLELYRKVPAQAIVTDTRTAAMLKYACNSFHALKIAFANEIGALARSLDADGQTVMELLCRDTRLNISPAYLRPGFAFGGSCLPKDMRAMVRYAEREAIQLTLLKSVLPSNQEHLHRAILAIEQKGCRKIGVVGLSFKTGTDDLRESPFVTLVETLIGRGYDVKIFDPGISIGRLLGKNLAYIDQHLPHLASLLVEDPDDILSHASLLVIGSDVVDCLGSTSGYSGEVIDLRSSVIATQPSTEPSVCSRLAGRSTGRVCAK